MAKWTNEDTTSYSGDSSSKVAAAEHAAPDDASKAGIFERGNPEKNSQRFSRDDDSGKAASSFWGSIFGK